ncbi:MAG: DNA integrity scanning protein DisA nucleotide-binding domain protein [Bacteroidia bacterium]|nr:DNA integrity scanning protein DisA nucleotide-binding domain protein [Bacteroidia bacterium]MDW8235481.1 DNA integrity scanning protein DisA nucleotide-binding domain protein [Bacteroidia bacterium]
MELFRLGLIPFTLQDLIDILLLSLLLYAMLRWFYRLNLLGLALLFVAVLVSQGILHLVELNSSAYFLKNALLWLGVLIAFVLSSDIRRFLQGLPSLSLFRKQLLSEAEVEKIAEEIVSGLNALVHHQLGALIVIEGNQELTRIIQSGIPVQMPVEGRLLLMIFEKKSPLHDGAVVIRGDKIIAARCVLPTTDASDLPRNYGQRHRSAIATAQQTDAFILVVSEETGLISIAERENKLERFNLPSIKQEIIKFYLR